MFTLSALRPQFNFALLPSRRYIIPFVKALLALTTYWKLESKGLDVKLNAKIVKEYLFQPSSNGSNNSQGNNGNPSTGSKRNRDGSAAGGGSGSRSQVPTILGKIHHPDILAIIGAVVQQSYNSSLDDSNLKVWTLPILILKEKLFLF